MIYTDPYEYDEDAEPLVRIYQEVEDNIIDEIARLISENKNAGTMAWYINRLAQTKALDKKVLQILAQRTARTEKAVQSAIFQALTKNAERYESTIAKASKDGLLGRTVQKMTPAEIMARTKEISEKFQRDNLAEVNRNIVVASEATYKKSIGNIFVMVKGKIKDFIKALADTLKQIGHDGIAGGMNMRDGKPVRTPIDTKVKREIVNQMVQESNRLMLERCEKDGIEYVEISAHMGARTGKKGFHPTVENPDPTNHAWWQGKAYKIHGEDEEYPNLIRITGYGTITGLCGINCRHHMFPFIPEVSSLSQPKIDQEENARIYELTQEQRALERAIRSAKRELNAVRYSDDKEVIQSAQKHLRKREQMLTAFLHEHQSDATYIYRQPDRLEI